MEMLCILKTLEILLVISQIFTDKFRDRYLNFYRIKISGTAVLCKELNNVFARFQCISI